MGRAEPTSGHRGGGRRHGGAVSPDHWNEVVSVALRPALLEVAGPRGGWLAGHHEPWSWAAPAGTSEEEPVERRFATAGRTDRLTLLRHLRNQDPGLARQLVAGTWAREPAAERAALLAEFSTGLSDDDEPFLEAALDDRAAAVREAAVDLLARLPSSR